jgi:hypothetical protein
MKLVLPFILAPLLASAGQAKTKEFTVENLLSAPRPQPPIPSLEGTQAISVVDNWDPIEDK